MDVSSLDYNFNFYLGKLQIITIAAACLTSVNNSCCTLNRAAAIVNFELTLIKVETCNHV